MFYNPYAPSEHTTTVQITVKTVTMTLLNRYRAKGTAELPNEITRFVKFIAVGLLTKTSVGK